jgi:hypothetical protein
MSDEQNVNDPANPSQPSASQSQQASINEADHDTSVTLLRVLEEKDKLIVSLKESSTRRDKLNEQQIRMLSVDNQNKIALLRNLQQRAKQFEYHILKKESELAIFRLTNEKVGEKVEALKTEIDHYKRGLQDELSALNRTIQSEFRQKDLFAQTITQEFHATVDKLEKKLGEVEDHYSGVINGIAEKQGSAKKLIREAMDRLQDALSFLDMGSVDLVRPKALDDEVGHIMDATRKQISRAEEEVRKEKSGDTIIRNIETVNIRMSSTPHIENIVSDIGRIRSNAEEELSKVGQLKPAELEDFAKKVGAAPAPAGQPPIPVMARPAGSAGGTSSAAPSAPSQAASSGGAPLQASTSAPAGAAQAGSGQSGAGGSPAQIQMVAPPTPKWNEENKNRTILDRDNFAPFDWKRILNDLQLAKYSDLIKVCNQAIKGGDLLKAIKLFKTIREQPGVLDQEVTTKMIDDEIEYLEKVIKDKYTRKPEMTGAANPG